ncbi:MAG: tRNA preQ1(34) S-adenosylmethionine ribosyltransferase-isomerase QueA [Chloroflexi bacterium]|nr:tRNA preQ1(34) S-adenosylmethionine ribosyltransferase-isomerase QueA [Chloroflexota bacterium]
MRTSDFDYPLPRELIAQTPVEPRDHSRLLVLDRSDGSITHRRRFYEIEEYLRPGDLLVLNDTRVMPARLHGRRWDTGGKVELLLLNRLAPTLWQAVGRLGKGIRVGSALMLGQDRPSEAWIVEKRDDGTFIVSLDEGVLEEAGEVPLPPYIKEPLMDQERYQTVYSRVPGSAAAPTAGLHFTWRLLERMKARGVRLAFVTLHIGLDTFQPVREEDPREHKLHSEYWEMDAETADAINAARSEGRRIIAVGSTSARILEEEARMFAEGEGFRMRPYSGWADIYILPGHRFLAVDALVTNFHLPRSTLLMLVCAFAGQELVLKAYQEAIEHRYRFYSLGDGMLIV